MNNKKKHKYHLMSPYIFTLSVCTIVLSTVLIIICVILSYLPSLNPDGPDYNWIICVVVEILLYLTFFIGGHQCISYFTIEENQLSLYSPGLKTWRLDLNTCTDIGIDYAIISGGIKQYWIYFSVEPVPRKYFHRINQLKYNKNNIRISYSDAHYAVMIENTSGKVRRQLENAHSVVVNAKRKGEEI